MSRTGSPSATASSPPQREPDTQQDVTGETTRAEHEAAEDTPTVSVIAPAYNEAENLTPLVRELVEVFDNHSTCTPYEVVLVDDGSSDGTRHVVHHLAELFDQVHGVLLTRNFGQSPALAAGIEYARGEYLVPIDADLQNDPADIPRLLDTLEGGYDCVSGWRRDRNDPWHKTLPSAIQTRLAKATGPAINDFGCTLKAYRADALDDINLYGEGHRYIPAKLYDKGYTVTEVEVNHRPREQGNSHYGMSRLVRGFVDLLFHWFWVRFSTRPLHLFGSLGFTSMAAGGLIGGVSLAQRYLFGVPLDPRTPRLVLTALLVIFGLQLLVFGVLAEMLTKLQYSDEDEYRIERAVN